MDFTKFIDLLKASVWQTAAIAAALGGAYWLILNGHLRDPGAAWVMFVVAAGLVCCALTLAVILQKLVGAVALPKRLAHLTARFQQKAQLRRDIPFLTEHEREIIGYLLHHQQKVFQADADGGYAATLISRGVVVRYLRAGQVFTSDDVPFVIPDHLWVVLAEHRDRFPYRPTQAHPWRIPWQLK